MSDATVPGGDRSELLDRWVARKVQPVVMIYLLAVFAAFLAVAFFVFHSAEAVQALVLAAVGAILAALPGVTSRVEYRATQSGVEKRKLHEKEPGQFDEAFRWVRLSHVKRTGHGFKFYLTMDETNPFRRFWKLHVSDEYGGEIHVEKKDLDRILGIVQKQGVTIS